MAQLVGTSCVRCGGRVTNELDSRFCPGCGNPVHDGCASTPAESGPTTCSTCGTDTAAAYVWRREEEVRREATRPALPPPPPLDVANLNWVLQVGKFAAGSVIALAFAITLFSMGETGAGIGLSFASVGIAGLAVLVYLRRPR